jgi:putative membrane protein
MQPTCAIAASPSARTRSALCERGRAIVLRRSDRAKISWPLAAVRAVPSLHEARTTFEEDDMRLAWVTLCAVLSAPLAVMADPTSSTTGTNKSETAKLGAAELEILAHLHQVNLMEIDAGTMTRTRSATPAIKEYGQMLVNDHSKADRNLQAIARKHHQTIPAQEPPANDTEAKQAAADKADMHDLAQLNGTDFDRKFLTMMIAGHEMELAKLAPEIGRCTADDMRAMLDDLRPALQKHADEARELANANAQASR